ncbi:helix-turn-helix domain-containing protein [Streptomyces sp. NPDC086787]|uniref:helix-turn-helix domain-containing protein n=1 Tax=Streptomyces sp. NPDC086787 TaxID=3365759 RepID=UPI00382F47B3
MSGWQPLPDELPSEVRHFVEQLRLLKDRTGLSLVALGARTAYSKSSWQRYLNAVQPPPRQAVAALCRVAGVGGPDAERHTVRWELAVQAWPRPAVAPDRPEGAAGAERYEDDPTVPWWERPVEEPPPRSSGRLLLSAVLLLLVLVLIAVAGVVAFA